MGMCGSQARLGMITARINQVEYRNESLAAKKISMTEDSYQTSNNYNTNVQNVYDLSTALSTKAQLTEQQNQFQAGSDEYKEIGTQLEAVDKQVTALKSALGITAAVTESTFDKDAAIAKLQSQFDTDSKNLERKETKIDLEMQQLDTERQALTTEKDSIDTALGDNIKRTFELFS